MTEYRVVLPDDIERWIAVQGRLCSDRSAAGTRMLGHDRSTFGEFSIDEQVTTVIHSFTVPEFEPLTSKQMPFEALPWYFDQLLQGNVVLFNRLEDLPPEAEKERQFCSAHSIQSHVAIPLKAGGAMLGLIKFSSFRQVGYWDQRHVSRVRMIGEVFANALLHKRDQQGTAGPDDP